MPTDETAKELKTNALGLPIFNKYGSPSKYVEEEVLFLREVEKYPLLYEENFVRRSIKRYESLWLPFVNANENKMLWVPLDIHWVWHCHVLAPRKYVADCEKYFEKILDKRISNSERDKEITLSLWEKMFPNEEFEVSLTEPIILPKHEFSSKLSYDIESAVQRQVIFNYQVSLPHYLNDEFLNTAVSRYKMFIALKKSHPDKFFVPTYDMDIVWHTHMQYPVLYKLEMEKVLNEHFDHDDSVNDRTPGSKLDVCGSETRKLWQENYKEDYFLFGTMYRGNPPKEKMKSLCTDALLQTCSKQWQVKPLFVHLRKNGKKFKNIKDFYLVFEHKNYTDTFEFFKEKDSGNKQEKKWIPKNECNSASGGSSEVKCYITIVKERNFYKKLTGGRKTRINSTFTVNEFTDEVDENTKSVVKPIIISISDSIEVAIEMEITFLGREPIPLYTKSGKEVKLATPSNKKKLLGFIPKPSFTIQKDLSVINNEIFYFEDNQRKLLLTCRITHSKESFSSHVQVQSANESLFGVPDGTLIVEAHPIGLNELPLLSQVCTDTSCMTLNPKKGQRALVIKNKFGDWALVKGHWARAKKPIKSAYIFRKGGAPGYLFLELWKKDRTDLTYHEIKSNSYLETFGDTEVNFQDGKILCDINKGEIAEYTALAFCTALLHCYCQPYSQNFLDSRNWTIENYEKNTTIPKSEKVMYFQAVGIVSQNNPTNALLRQNLTQKSSGVDFHRKLLSQVYGLNNYHHCQYWWDDINDENTQNEKGSNALKGNSSFGTNEEELGNLDGVISSNALDEENFNSFAMEENFSSSMTEAFGGIVSQSDVDFSGGYEPFSNYGSSSNAASDSIWASSNDTDGYGGYDGGSSYDYSSSYRDYDTGGFSSSYGGGGSSCGGGGCGGGGCGGGGDD